MTVLVVVPPEPVISLDRVKLHLRVDHDDEDDLIKGYLAAATAWIDGPAGWLGRCIGAQTVELVDCAFGNDRLPYGPVVSIESISYRGADLADHVMPPTGYILLSNGSVAPVLGTSWPSLAHGPESVRIRYVAGYPDRLLAPVDEAEPVKVTTVPAAIQQAILLLVGQWWITREGVNIGNIVNEMPFAVEALLSPFRVWR